MFHRFLRHRKEKALAMNDSTSILQHKRANSSPLQHPSARQSSNYIHFILCTSWWVQEQKHIRSWQKDFFSDRDFRGKCEMHLFCCVFSSTLRSAYTFPGGKNRKTVLLLETNRLDISAAIWYHGVRERLYVCSEEWASLCKCWYTVNK